MRARCALGALSVIGLVIAAPALAQEPPTVVVVEPPRPEPPPASAYPYRYNYAPPRPREQESPDQGFSAKLYAGATYQRIFDAPIAGAEIGASVGGLRGISGWYGGLELMVGQLDPHLVTFAVRPGGTWEARLGRAHVGVGLGLVFFGVQRATTPEIVGTFGAGPSVFASVDLVRSGDHALFLGARLRADFVSGTSASGASPVLWGPSGSLGWRYR